MRGAERTADLAGRKETAGFPDGERYTGLEQRHVEVLPYAAALSLPQRGQDAERDIEAAHQIADRHADLRRRPIGRARDAHQAAARLGHDVETRSIRERTVLTEPRRRGVNDPRVHGADVVVGQAERAHRAGAQILDDDVRRRGEPQERLLALGRLQVEHDGTLESIQAQERRALAVDERSRRTHGLAGDALDLDDVGAEIRELQRRERRRDEDADLEDANARQRAGICRRVFAAHSQPGTTSTNQATNGTSATIEKPHCNNRR